MAFPIRVCAANNQYFRRGERLYFLMEIFFSAWNNMHWIMYNKLAAICYLLLQFICFIYYVLSFCIVTYIRVKI